MRRDGCQIQEKQEFWLEPGQTVKDVRGGFKKVMVNPYFATILAVVLGMTGYGKIWGLCWSSKVSRPLQENIRRHNLFAG